MIQDDIENLNFNELNEIEKQEYIAVLTLNARKLVLQLMNSGDYQLASLFSFSISIASLSPSKLLDLLRYASKLYEIIAVEQKTARRANEATLRLEEAAKKNQEKEDNFPELNTDKEQ